MSETLYAIIVNLPTAEQREGVQSIVKRDAEQWWHGFADLWIVSGGGNASAWRDRVGSVFPSPPSGVIVLKLDTATPAWASRAKLTDSSRAWLHKHLPSRSRS